MRTSAKLVNTSLPSIARVFAPIVFAMTLLAAVAFVAGPAAAQQLAMPRLQLVKVLRDRYAEAPVAMGLASNGEVIEIFATADGATWTIAMTMPSGLSRVVISGEAWVQLPAQLVGEVS